MDKWLKNFEGFSFFCFWVVSFIAKKQEKRKAKEIFTSFIDLCFSDKKLDKNERKKNFTSQMTNFQNNEDEKGENIYVYQINSLIFDLFKTDSLITAHDWGRSLTTSSSLQRVLLVYIMNKVK